MSQVNWGIIGCGDVTEVKSGPAFNKVPHSKLVAVMRRDADKAKDYAQRHGVPKWYHDAQALINDPDINAIYVATPPAFHEDYVAMAARAGKPVYVEKPAALSEQGCINMAAVCREQGTKITVAHYRRQMPLFLKIKELIATAAIGKIRCVHLKMLQPHKAKMITQTADNWRVNPALSGGGLFHDLAPHQLDLMLYFFGKPLQMAGLATNNAQLYEADDTVAGTILFPGNIIFNGLWCFATTAEAETDICEIMGAEGKISFAVFGKTIEITKGNHVETLTFEPPVHVQQPMIAQVVQYFRNEMENPCTVEEAAWVMQVMDAFTQKME